LMKPNRTVKRIMNRALREILRISNVPTATLTLELGFTGYHETTRNVRSRT
jgi:hypothetical protein